MHSNIPRAAVCVCAILVAGAACERIGGVFDGGRP